MGEDLLTSWVLIAIVGVGMVAGLFGGMLGIGGSIIIIPSLTLVLGPNQHLYQAAAMIVNVAVAVPAFLRHRRAGVLVPAALKWMLPAALVFVLVGVWLSNRPALSGVEGGLWLGRILAVFLVYIIGVNIVRLAGRIARHGAPAEQGPWKVAPPRSASVGGGMGLIAGLLGIGGGALAVPLQQLILKLPLRNCIGNSAAIMCISAGLGAIYKNATLAQHAATAQAGDADPRISIAWQSSLVIAAILAPTAWLGARWGAGLTHRLPMWQVRVVFIILMAAAAFRMAAIPGLSM